MRGFHTLFLMKMQQSETERFILKQVKVCFNILMFTDIDLKGFTPHMLNFPTIDHRVKSSPIPKTYGLEMPSDLYNFQHFPAQISA